MKEIWRDIEGYENLYQISNLGRVKSLGNDKTRKEKILKVCRHTFGYLLVGLFKDGNQKSYYIHRLVACAFLPNPDNLSEINHKDEDKTNNRVENLEWCNRKYNMNYGTRTERQLENTNNPKRRKQVICIETGKIYPSTMQVERELGFNKSGISHACRGNQKTAYGFHWRYI